ncbi:hypothetical protein Slala05_70900 [Streptomyces lavendulae subsp. lavendulae]|nr:hypothetical protein Slala05_70900 [Streptomyces lavendulae subsp. lavendulae]
MRAVVGACGGEALVEGMVGGVPDDPEPLQLGGPLAGHGSGAAGVALLGEPPPARAGAFGVLVGDLEVALAFPAAEGGFDAAAPVLPLGVGDPVADPLRDQGWAAGGCAVEEEPVLVLAVGGCFADQRRRLHDAFLVPGELRAFPRRVHRGPEPIQCPNQWPVGFRGENAPGIRTADPSRPGAVPALGGAEI